MFNALHHYADSYQLLHQLVASLPHRIHHKMHKSKRFFLTKRNQNKTDNYDKKYKRDSN